MLTAFVKFLKGYVKIRLTGYSPERFLNLCGRYHMIIWELQNKGTEYEMCISISSFKKLRPLLRKTGTKAVILERHGLPFILYRYRKRKMFAAGAAGAAVLLYGMSLFIWNIHIEGTSSLSDPMILEFLEEQQVVHGMRKTAVHGSWIEEALRKQFPEITWTSVEVKGTRLIIHIKENEDADYGAIPEPDQPAELVAKTDGTVVSMIVRSGTQEAQIGQLVKQGDLLVSSKIEVLDDAGEPAHTYYVHADADVIIRSSGHYESSFPLQYRKKEYTGRKKTCYYVILGNKRITFGHTGDIYEEQDVLTKEMPLKLTENFYLPVSFGKSMIKEYISEEVIYTEREAQEKAQQELSLFFEKLRRKGLQIIENNVKIESNGVLCRASGTYVTEENAVQEQAPRTELPTQDDPEEERERTSSDITG